LASCVCVVRRPDAVRECAALLLCLVPHLRCMMCGGGMVWYPHHRTPLHPERALGWRWLTHMRRKISGGLLQQARRVQSTGTSALQTCYVMVWAPPNAKQSLLLNPTRATQSPHTHTDRDIRRKRLIEASDRRRGCCDCVQINVCT
jgi:hypothetical protein